MKTDGEEFMEEEGRKKDKWEGKRRKKNKWKKKRKGGANGEGDKEEDLAAMVLEHAWFVPLCLLSPLYLKLKMAHPLVSLNN